MTAGRRFDRIAVVGAGAWGTALALTLRERKDSKYQNPSEQVRVRAKDRVELIKMDPVRPAPPAPVEEKQA